MSSSAPVDALVQRILDKSAPLQLRSAAARGALPLPRSILARLYLHLRDDPEEAVRADAKASLDAIGADVVGEVLADPICPPEVLLHYAGTAARNEALAEKLAFHPHVPGEALSILASDGNANIIDLVITNQERLLKTEGLLDRLTVNPALRPDQRVKILDLLDQFFSAGESAAGADVGEAPDAGGVDAQEAARILEVDVGELFAASEILDAHEFETAADPMIQSAYKKILTLNTAQKAMLAMKGGREERSILIRDTNKVVALSVLKNPRLTEREVEAIAGMRNVTDEVLRTVGINREWSKSYTVVGNLVRNPRTPPGISTNFVQRLQTKDIKNLAQDKNVPEIIRRMAKRTYDLRTQKDSPSFKKR
jgi:hypothetical protein